MTLSIGELGIDFTRHSQHHARGLFVRIIVAGEIALHVAEGALLTKRDRERTHRHDELRSTLSR